MVKAVVGEETRLQLAENRLSESAIPAQVGLLIGKLSSTLDRGFIFDLIPTPPNDAGEPPCTILDGDKGDKKKGSKAKSSSIDSSSLAIDKDWVAEHARQVIKSQSRYWSVTDDELCIAVVAVSRMLVGGVRVVGIYVWVGDAAYKNSTMLLCQTIKGVAEAAPLAASDWDERLLVHICYSPRRWTCRNCSLASNITSSSLRPCDFKMGRVLSALQAFKCTYNFDIRLPVHENKSRLKTINDVLRHAISIHANELRGSKAMIDGKLVNQDEPSTSDGLHEVELLLPYMKGSSFEGSSGKDILGLLTLSGSVCSYAYVNSKEPYSEALTEIKDDIIMSLKSRLDIICDEADGDTEAENEISAENSTKQLLLQSLRNPCILPFPRRLFVPWLAGIYVCDYLQPSETFEVLEDHFVELLSMEAPKDATSVLEPETETLRLTTRSFWEVASPLYPTSDSKYSSGKNNAASKACSPRSSARRDLNGLLGVLVLIISVIVGLVFHLRNHSQEK